MKKYRNILPLIVIVIGLLVQLHMPGIVLGQTSSADSLSRSLSRSHLDLLQSQGIDLSDTETAVQKARDLGIPERTIKDALEEYKSETNIRTLPSAVDSLVPAERGVLFQSGREDTTETESPEESLEEIETIEPEFPAATDTTAVTEEETDKFTGTGRWYGLRYYGYDIFTSEGERVGPIEIGPVDPGYPVGSGDELRLVVWGASEFQYILEVDKEGKIIIPQAGQVFVAGTRLENLRETLKNYLSKFYSGLTADPPTTFMDLTLSRLRTNQVYIMGEVGTPGANAVSSYATAFNVMYAVGGPTITGSLRDVRILREGKIAARIDMYDYILKGNSTDDRRLQNNDIVFVPPRLSTVGIKGEILRPGIYETLKDETLKDLITLAGGLKQTAYSFRAQIDRIVPFEERKRGDSDRKLIDVDIYKIMTGQSNIALMDGDIVTVFPINNIVENYVDIEGGGIERPGRYMLDERIVQLSDLITEADGLTGDAYTVKADIVRTRDDFTEEMITVNLQNVLMNRPGSDIELKRWDRVHVYSKTEMTDNPTVTLGGFVKNPGTYPYYENSTVYDLLFKYSGLQDSLRYARTFMGHGDIFRLREDGKTRYLMRFNIYDEWNRLTEASLPLEPEDEVFVYSNEVKDIIEQTVHLHGEVKNPGEFRWEDNLTVNDLILKGGGFTDRAWFLEVEISRVPLAGLRGEHISQTTKVKLYDGNEYPDNPEDAIHKILNGSDTEGSFKLEAGDHVFVRTNPDYKPIRVVSISGEIRYPGAYNLISENESLSSVIQRAGGLTESASIQGGQLYRDGERVFIDFSRLINRRNSKEDIVLLDGDEVVIPQKISTVMVTGEVFNPGYYKYVAGMRAKDYLSQSGGRTENSGDVFITQPTGRTYQLGFFRNPQAMEGAVITVNTKPPEEESDIDWSETVIDTFSVLSGAMTIVYLAYSINQ